LVFLAFVVLNVTNSLAAADEAENRVKLADEELPGFERRELVTYRVKVTLRVDAPGAAVSKVVATSPVPTNWREQTARLVEEVKPPGVSAKVYPVGINGALLLMKAPGIPAGGSVAVEQIYEITRYRLKFTGDTETLKPPEKLSPELRGFLQPGPGVESNRRGISKLADSLRKEDANAWSNVRAFRDWIRENVRYQQGAYRGAAESLENKIGDCEDMTALLVALCHSSGIPARTVWLDGHAYPEFYLEDEDGRGYWIPTELVGGPWFGETGEQRPILQKGDRIYNSIRRRYEHYIAQSAQASGTVRLHSTREILREAAEKRSKTEASSKP
jgi:transglutaminase-like putative cysteine protease